MKLRNKNTGEIATLTLSSNGEELLLMKNNEMVTRNVKLSDLEGWEDYEKPKEYWYISDGGEVYGFSEYFVDSQIEDDHREIGNLFETKEEAEKAVEKLKAWKRLKDKGFRIFGYYHRLAETKSKGEIGFEMDDYKCTKQDLDLLFGGKE